MLEVRHYLREEWAVAMVAGSKLCCPRFCSMYNFEQSTSNFYCTAMLESSGFVCDGGEIYKQS